jgi:hypothetical protein
MITMNKEQFLDYVQTHLNETFPLFQFEKNANEFSLHFFHEGKNDIFYLSNLYKEYQQNEIENVLHPLTSFFSNFNNKEQSIPNFNRDKVIPIIRPFKEDKYLSQEVTDDLSMGFAIEHNEYIQYIEEAMLNDLFDEEKVEKQAKKNLLEKGWFHPQKEEHSYAGRMLLFQNHEQEFLAQFFFSEMAEQHVGRDFYLIVPTKHIAFVLMPNRIDTDGVIEGLLKLKEFAVKLKFQESYGISEKVYHVLNGSITTIG